MAERDYPDPLEIEPTDDRNARLAPAIVRTLKARGQLSVVDYLATQMVLGVLAQGDLPALARYRMVWQPVLEAYDLEAAYDDQDPDRAASCASAAQGADGDTRTPSVRSRLGCPP